MYCFKVFDLLRTKYNKVILKTRQRYFCRIMASIDLNPPLTVRGMVNLDKSAFKKIIQVPKLNISKEFSNKILPVLKKYILKLEKFKAVRPLLDGNKDMKEIIFNPLAVNSWNCLPIKDLEKYNIMKSDMSFICLELTYDNWRADQIFKAIFSVEQESFTSFSRIGHIVHINLRDHLLPYKKLIGDVLKDKIVGCRTVVNKASNIDNTYRFFELELVCGTPDYKVEVKENGIIFEFDFSKVYWNPRLSTEHERIIKLLNSSDILYDVFAGVGPFSVPAAKKKCQVLANDLNPDSFKWLNQNVKRNKCNNYIKTFNKDGRDFILNDIRNGLLKIWQNMPQKTWNNIHITMNLPAKATEFLDAFSGLFSDELISDKIQNYPLVHIYSFAKGENTKEVVKELVERNLGTKFTDNLVGIYFVRNVAPNKDMYRISFYLTKEILFSNKAKKRSILENIDTSIKKICS